MPDPYLVQRIDFDRVDFHVHAKGLLDLSDKKNGKTLKKEIECAERRGLICIALTDHWDPIAHPSIFVEERKEIDQAETELKVFLSAEVEIINIKGDSPVNPKTHINILRKMDYLSASPHMDELRPKSSPRCVPWSLSDKDIPKDKRGIIDYGQRKHMNMLKNELFDLVLHPYKNLGIHLFMRGLTRFISLDDIPERYMEEFAEAAAFYKKGIEITNTDLDAAKIGMKSYGDYEQSYRVLVEKLLKAGAKITVGSDCHPPGDDRWVGKTEEAVRIIRECGGDNSSLWLPRKRKFLDTW